jgi:hypothetical protein
LIRTTSPPRSNSRSATAPPANRCRMQAWLTRSRGWVGAP